MAVIIINPNSTSTMTDAMLAQARTAAPGVRFEGWTSEKGPPSIQGAEDGALAAPPLLDLVRKASSAGAEGIVIGCFDDTALQQAAAMASCPVIGLGQASYHFAALRGWQFSVVTTLAVSVPILEDNVRQQGLGPYLARVRASDVPVLELEADPAGASKAIVQEALSAQAKDGVSAVVLGCAGMVQVLDAVQQALTIETIDPVTCSARCMTWLTA